MKLNVADDRVEVVLRPLTGGRRRLVVTYPAEASYQRIVAAALAELLVPPDDETAKKRP